MTGQVLGIFLIAFGILVAVFGEKEVNSKGGKISKVFSMLPLNARVLKWAVALTSIWFGVALLLGGGHL